MSAGAQPRSRFVIGVDVGGTCTDCVVMGEDGETTVAKAYSTPADFSEGVLEALSIAAQELGTTVQELLPSTWLFLHSTTVAENAISDGTLARAGLVATSGFRDTLSVMRGGFGRWSGLTEDEKRNPVGTSKPPPIVPIERIRTVKERVDRQGDVFIALAPSDAEHAVRELVAEGVDAIGVCLLWSFANPAHELMMRSACERFAPDAFLALSHELAPVVGEYERTSTVALNASLGPTVSAYLDRLRARLVQEGFAGNVLVMQAHGGLVTAERARRRPVGMIESGPVGGLIGCKQLGELVGVRNIISADMGGTTFKVGVVRDSLIDYQHESQVFRYHYALPKMNVVSLGLAGGSIVSIDERTGIPQIGPRGAGSYPGPIAYGHGGREVTVTDVDAILGFMNPEYFLGGRETLDVSGAAEIFEQTIADPLGLPLLQAAGAIYKLANSHIYDLLHRTTVQRGLDPRLFVLFSTGGTSGMHLPALAQELGVLRLIVPYTASVHGAFGLLTSDVVHEELLTKPMRHPADPDAVAEILHRLEESVWSQLREDGFDDEDISVSRAVDMHFRRQVHEVSVPLPNGEKITAGVLEQLAEDFAARYTERYGPESTWPGATIELVTFRVRAAGRLRRPALKRWPEAAASLEDALVEVREVFLPALGQSTCIPGYDLERLGVGAQVQGPALIWSPITTILVGGSQSAIVDAYRNVVIETADVQS